MDSSSPPSSDHEVDDQEEDYIDMEVSSSTFFCYSNITSPHPREFEFQMTSKSLEKELTTHSPADELFYKGKLLPLHLPPRLQMVEKLLQNSNNTSTFDHGLQSEEEVVFEVMDNNTPLTTTNTTPFTSCNITPTGSCQISRELNPDEYFFECSNDVMSSSFIDDEHKKKSWAKKLKLIKQISLGSMKLKASRGFLKSLFTKSGGCSSDEAAKMNVINDQKTISDKAKECLNKYVKVGKKKNPFGQIQRQRDHHHHQMMIGTDKEKMIEDNGSHRRSFSGAIKRHSATKSSISSSSSSSSGSSSSSSLLSSTSSTSSSNGFYEVHLLKRSNSANSEFESSIQGAIAHCKQSQSQSQSQQILISRSSRKTVSEVGGICSLTASRIAAACEDQERPQLCRG